MRKNGICPECSGRQFWRIQPVPNLAVTRNEVKVNFLVTDKLPIGHFELFVCKGCGLSRWYALGLEELKENPTLGVHSVDFSLPQEGPYR
jgi:hypothetical protein